MGRLPEHSDCGQSHQNTERPVSYIETFKSHMEWLRGPGGEKSVVCIVPRHYSQLRGHWTGIPDLISDLP